MDSAAHYFSKGASMCPDLLEPRKYLVDALHFQGRTEDAKEECISTFVVYPDESMFLKLDDACKLEGGDFERHWMRRGCDVNSIGDTQTRVENRPWNVYQAARDEIAPYCDSNGVITATNDLTEAKYLEVYSWEKMLAAVEGNSPQFAFAKEMHDRGFLDCYVFISLFHFDLYDQYLSFVKDNKVRVQSYVESFLIEE
jgi:hypothetical protein